MLRFGLFTSVMLYTSESSEPPNVGAGVGGTDCVAVDGGGEVFSQRRLIMSFNIFVRHSYL